MLNNRFTKLVEFDIADKLCVNRSKYRNITIFNVLVSKLTKHCGKLLVLSKGNQKLPAPVKESKN